MATNRRIVAPASPPRAAAIPTFATTVPNLPGQLTPLIGRGPELERLKDVLPTTRLLTLTGAGGSGKTRLAIALADLLSPAFHDGAVWVELAPISDPDIIPSQVRRSLADGIVEEQVGLQGLTEHLASRELLLVLDNCEHLIDAAASFADHILRNCPNVRILATSREPLGVDGERAWLVPPLTPPDPAAPAAAIGDSVAVQLFVARARDVSASFELTSANAAAVAEICRRLDGIPLAIELAAARIGVLAPAQISARLDNVFNLLTGGKRTAVRRQQTLRAAMDWSYSLLSASERIFYRRLAIFTDGFTIDAAEGVCGVDEIDPAEVLDLLASLVEKSLVVAEESDGHVRYRLLETVRQYALEKLREGTEEERLRRRHAAFYVADLEEVSPKVVRAVPGRWLLHLEEEYGNLRAALRHAIDAADAETAGRLATALTVYWTSRGSLREGYRWVTDVLAVDGLTDYMRGKLLFSAGTLAAIQHDWDDAHPMFEQCLAINRAIGDELPILRTLGRLSSVEVARSNFDRAAELLDEAWILAERSGDGVRLTEVLNERGRLALASGDLPAAADFYRRGRETSAAAGNPEAPVLTSNLAQVLTMQGELESARALLTDSLRTSLGRGQSLNSSQALLNFGRLLIAEGRDLDAARVLGASEVAFGRHGTATLIADREAFQTEVDGVRARLGAERFHIAQEEGRAMTFDEAVALAKGPAGAKGDAAFGGTPSPEVADSAASESPSFPEQSPPAGESDAVAPFLRIRALGPLELELNGRAMTDEEWIYSRPRELLIYLLSHPRGRTREQIGLVFWPESSPAQVKNSFHVALHRLRKSLGSPEVVVFVEDRYRINPDLRIDFDAATFERAMPAAIREAEEGDEKAVHRLLELYRGDFLEQETVGDWHLEVDDRLRRLFVDGAEALAQSRMGRRDYSGAVQILEKLVARESLNEEANRMLIEALARAGRRDRALAHLERFTTVLRLELEAEPSERTLQLGERIRREELTGEG